MNFDNYLIKPGSLLLRALLIMTSVALVIGCSTKLPKYDAANISPDSSSTSIDGLTVTAHHLSSAEISEYFGFDDNTLFFNDLIIFVLIENNSKNISYILPKEHITFHHLKNAIKSDDSTVPVRYDGMVKASTMKITLDSHADAYSFKAFTYNPRAIKHAFVTNQYQTKSLSPGESAQGFLYYYLPNEFSGNNYGLLQLLARDPLGNNSVELQLYIQLNLSIF